jgi:hypothetical protein|tara:strand:+ start:512 stop:649 length:138 start_codon:yes stop_codon:yes gene_type:complete
MPFKKYSAKQKKLAAVAPPRKKITGADLKKLAKKKKGKKNAKKRS